MDPRLAFSYLNVPLIPFPDLPKAMEELLDTPGHARSAVDPLAMSALDPQETKAHDETSFGVFPEEATTFATIQHATLSHANTTPQHWQYQQQQYGHFTNYQGANNPTPNSSAPQIRHEQFGDFDVAAQAVASSSTLGPSGDQYSESTIHDDDGFLDPNKVLPLALNAGFSNGNANSHIRFSQSPAPSSSRSTSVVSSRPPSAASGPLVGISHTRYNEFSPSPTPPLTRSGSAMSRRSQNIATPSPVATPFIHDGQLSFFPPYARDDHVHHEPMIYTPEGPVAGPSTIPVHQPDLALVQSVDPCGVNPHAHHGADVHWDNTPQPAPQWQQSNFQEAFSAPVPLQGHRYQQAPRVWQGNVMQYNVAPQQTPTMAQHAPVQQNLPPRSPPKKKLKTSRPKVKEPSGQSKAKADIIGTNIIVRPSTSTSVFVCYNCPKRPQIKGTSEMQRHFKSIHLKSRWFCPNPDCTTNTNVNRRGGPGYARKDEVIRHVKEKCMPWLPMYYVLYPTKKAKKNN